MSAQNLAVCRAQDGSLAEPGLLDLRGWVSRAKGLGSMQAVIPETDLPEPPLPCSSILLDPALHLQGQPSPDTELAVECAQDPRQCPLFSQRVLGTSVGVRDVPTLERVFIRLLPVCFPPLPPRGRECSGSLSEAVPLAGTLCDSCVSGPHTLHQRPWNCQGQDI